MKFKTKLSSLAAVLSLGVAGLAPGLAQAAGAGVFSLSPAGGSYAVGNNFSLVVDENGEGNAVSVVTIDLSYNASQLEYAGASCAGAFSAPASSASGGGGSVSLSCFTPGGSTAPTGAAEAAVIDFRALAGSGSTVVSFGSGSEMASNGVNVWNGDPTGGTYSLFTPAPVAPAPTHTTTPTSTGTTGTTTGGSVQGTSTTNSPSSTPSNSSTKQTVTAPVNSHTNTPTAAKGSTGHGWVYGLVAGLIGLCLIAGYTLFFFRKAVRKWSKTTNKKLHKNFRSTSKRLVGVYQKLL